MKRFFLRKSYQLVRRFSAMFKQAFQKMSEFDDENLMILFHLLHNESDSEILCSWQVQLLH